MKISIAEVKRRLPVGTEFIGEFIGNNARHAEPGNVRTRRRVVHQKSNMESLMLEGPKKGHKIYLQWSGMKAREEDGNIIISDANTENWMQGDFLKIEIL